MNFLKISDPLDKVQTKFEPQIGDYKLTRA